MKVARRTANGQPQAPARGAKPSQSFTHKMKRITRLRARVLFDGIIAPGTGHHHYVCAECAGAVLRGVDVRYPSGAVYKCTACACLNVVARLEDAPEEARERFTRLYAEALEA